MSAWRYRVSSPWRGLDKPVWAVGSVIALVLFALGYLSSVVAAHKRERQELFCLALNVYFEARGEPREGQFAVAEVTMNRVASNRYPATICGVVHQQNWDPLRKRYVAAFSWTEFSERSMPEGRAWREALEIAEAVYERRYEPKLAGALHYHATYIKPSWARGRKPIARIGGHLFYP